MTKFQRIPDDLKRTIIDRYLAGGITQRELGEEFGFDYRRIVHWCKDAGLYDEYKDTGKQNRITNARKPMDALAKTKISDEKSIDWKGKKVSVRHGEISAILIPSAGHPNRDSQGYVPQHRLVMEDSLGRYLTKDEIVHHIDLDPSNNKIDNLMVISRQEHSLLHYHLQLSLVQLLGSHDLRELSHSLLENIRSKPELIRESKRITKKKVKNGS